MYSGYNSRLTIKRSLVWIPLLRTKMMSLFCNPFGMSDLKYSANTDGLTLNTKSKQNKILYELAWRFNEVIGCIYHDIVVGLCSQLFMRLSYYILYWRFSQIGPIFIESAPSIVFPYWLFWVVLEKHYWTEPSYAPRKFIFDLKNDWKECRLSVTFQFQRLNV